MASARPVLTKMASLHPDYAEDLLGIEHKEEEETTPEAAMKSLPDLAAMCQGGAWRGSLLV